MEGQTYMLNGSLLLFVLMVLNIGNMLFINARDVYYITDGINTEKKDCYKCPAGREPMHECWRRYTKEEDNALSRACNICTPGSYKELPDNEENYDRCIPCALCFGFVVIQKCDPRHGRICGNTCRQGFYLKGNMCNKCCQCTSRDKKEEGCKSSTSGKFCGSDSNGECKEQVHSLPLKSSQSGATTIKTQMTERRSKTSSSTKRPIVTMNAYSLHSTSLKTKEMSSVGTLSPSYSVIFSHGELKSTRVTTPVATKMHTEPTSRLTSRSTSRSTRLPGHTVTMKVSSSTLTMSSAVLPYSRSLLQPSTAPSNISDGFSVDAIIWIVGGVLFFIAILIGLAIKAKESGLKCCIGGDEAGSRRQGAGGSGNDNTENTEMDKLLARPNGELYAATGQTPLSKLKDNYNLVQYLESNLEGASINGIKDLLCDFALPYKDRCKILKCATPSLAFFENLSKSKPQLKLLELKASIEKKVADLKPNMEIFRKIKKDIANNTVPITLDTTLGDLSSNAKEWFYFLEEVACHLVPEEGIRLISWKNIACEYNYTSPEIDAFERKNNEKSPTRKLLEFLCAKYPSMPVSLFVDKLRNIGREDVAKEVEKWLDGIVVSIVTNKSC